MILEKQIKKERGKAALEATIKTVIKISRYYGASDNETAVNLIKELDITREEAEKLICNYDKEMDDEALEDAVRASVLIAKRFNYDYNETIKSLQKNFHFSEKEAKKAFDTYE